MTLSKIYICNQATKITPSYLITPQPDYIHCIITSDYNPLVNLSRRTTHRSWFNLVSLLRREITREQGSGGGGGGGGGEWL